MKSSELKPLVLKILMEIYEVNPSPKAYGSISSLANNTKNVSPAKMQQMVEHLHHIGLVDVITINSEYLLSINDKGTLWLKEHNDSESKKSITSWLLKPLVIAALVTSITSPISGFIGFYLGKQLSQEKITQIKTPSNKLSNEKLDKQEFPLFLTPKS